jgi:signal recognition particle receptor subunit beta
MISVDTAQERTLLIPIVLQYNKQDLPRVIPMEAVERTLNAR